MSNKRTILSSSSLQQEDNVNSEGDIWIFAGLDKRRSTVSKMNLTSMQVSMFQLCFQTRNYFEWIIKQLKLNKIIIYDRSPSNDGLLFMIKKFKKNEFGFRRIWRTMQISEGVIHLGLLPR